MFLSPFSTLLLVTHPEKNQSGLLVAMIHFETYYHLNLHIQ